MGVVDAIVYCMQALTALHGDAALSHLGLRWGRDEEGIASRCASRIGRRRIEGEILAIYILSP